MRSSVLVGNIIIPQKVDRNEYVKFAIKSSTACVLTDRGDFLKNCPISSSYCGYNDGWVNAMEYPPDEFTLGTQVVLLNINKKQNIPIIIGCLNPKGNGGILNEEYQFEISRKFQDADSEGVIIKDKSVIIKGRGLEGILSLIANSSDGTGGKINVSAKNGEQTGELNFKTNYWNIYGNKQVNISSDEEVNIQVNFTDDDEVKTHSIQITTDNIKLEHSEGSFVDIVEDTITLEHKDGKKVEIGEDDVKFNGGSRELIDYAELKAELNKNKARVNDLVSALQNVSFATDYSGAAVAASLIAAASLIVDKEDYGSETILNDEVLH